ncbi:MAG: peptidoglycan-binding domain-containing protein [bacterium]
MKSLLRAKKYLLLVIVIVTIIFSHPGITRADDDGIGPNLVSFTSQTADSTYGPGSQIIINANFDTDLNSFGDTNMQVQLDSGAIVDLNSNNGNSVLVGIYTVGGYGSGENSSDLTVASIVSATNIQDQFGSTGVNYQNLPGSNLANNSNIVVNTVPLPAFSGGDGSSGNPYQITTCTQLQEIGSNTSLFNKDYKMMNNIDCSDTINWNSGNGFDPIGDATNPFTGTFDGDSKTIDGLYISRADNSYNQSPTDEEYVGIFGATTNATISHLRSTNAMIKGYLHVGGIVGHADNTTFNDVQVNVGTADNTCNPGHCVWARFGEAGGGIVGTAINGTTITNAETGGPVKGSGNTIGGIVGYIQDSSISDSISRSNIDGGYYIGGIAGNAIRTSFDNVQAYGDVLLQEEDFKTGNYGGGFVGIIEASTVSDSSASGNVGGNELVGGFAGMISSTSVVDTTASGNVHVSQSYAGGFAGETICGSTFLRVHALGDVTSLFGNYAGGFSGFDGCEGPGSTFTQVSAQGDVTGNNNVGGFLGYSGGSTFVNAYASGNVTAVDNVGGFAGNLAYSSLTNVYSRGAVTAGEFAEYQGGFLGATNEPTLSNTFWDGDTANQEFPCASMGHCGSNITQLTTTQAKTRSTYTNTGWDFDTIWTKGSYNDGYPHFQWEAAGNTGETITVTTAGATAITKTSAILGGTITAGQANSYGVFLGTESHTDGELPEYSPDTLAVASQLSALYPISNGLPSAEVSAPYSYETSLDGFLECGTTYYYRALVFRLADPLQLSELLGIGIGNERSFTTVACNDATPTISTGSSGGGSQFAWTPQGSNNTVTPVNTSTTPDNDKNTCPADQILTQNMRAGARNGKYHPYTKAIVREVKILQAHMNRLGFNSGPVDGILGKLTDGAIKRMQKYLGTDQDGLVGPKTRGLINNSCGAKGL